MKRVSICFAVWACCSLLSHAGQLLPLANRFVSAVEKLDRKQLAEIYMDSPTKQNAIDAFAEAAPMIASGKLKIDAIENELIIGDLGVTLMRLKFAEQPEPRYKPLIFVRADGVWKVFPWATEADMKVLFDQRNAEERIHLKLFDEWGAQMEELLQKQAVNGTAPETSKATE